MHTGENDNTAHREKRSPTESQPRQSNQRSPQQTSSQSPAASSSTSSSSPQVRVHNKSSAHPRPSNKTSKHPHVKPVCSRKTMMINFEDIGWNDWIIAPIGYDAGMCTGPCSFPLHDMNNATNHAVIKSIFHSAARAVSKPTCIPVKLNSLAMLFSIDGVIQLKTYSEMIVETCGCA